MVCITRHSNPPPTITWLLGDLAINTTNQNNTSEQDSHKWRSEATLEYMFSKTDMGKKLHCLVSHPAYPTGENSTLAKLDVLCEADIFLFTYHSKIYFVDKPSVHIARVDSPVLEEGSGSVSLTCISEANPPAQVMWSKQGDNSSPQYQDKLQFNPVTRNNAGTYICQAENSVGRSDQDTTDLDILCELKNWGNL